MSIIDTYSKYLRNVVNVVEILIYTFALILIVLSVLYSIFVFITEINDINMAFDRSRLILGESVYLALTFILAIEILQIFYIKTYRQLVIVVVLILSKLVINYFLIHEIENIEKKE